MARKKSSRQPLELRAFALLVILTLAVLSVSCEAKKRVEVSKDLHSKRNSKENYVKVAASGSGASGGTSVSAKLNVCEMDDFKLNVFCHCPTTEWYNATSADCTVFGAGEPENSSFWESFSSQPFLERLKIKIRLTQHQFIPTKALSCLRRLKYFQLTYGAITEIPPFAFANLSSLQELNLSSNDITILKLRSFAWMSNLTKVTLSKNNIGEIQRDVFMGLTALKQLYLDQNNISVIHDKAFFHLTSLAELSLSENQLEVLTREVFQGLKSLWTLDLQHNHVRMLGECTFCEMPHLKELYLTNNALSFIHARAFEGLRSLERLSLDGNQLKTLHPLTFVGLSKIYYLNIRRNMLTALTKETMSPFIVQLYNESSNFLIEENNYICDCRLSWMLTIRNETPNENIRETFNEVTCTFPNTESNNVVNGGGVSYVLDQAVHPLAANPGNLQEITPHGVKSEDPESEHLDNDQDIDHDREGLSEEQSNSGPVYKLSSVLTEEQLPCPEELKKKPQPSETPNILEEDPSSLSNQVGEKSEQKVATLTGSSANQAVTSAVALLLSVVIAVWSS